MFFPSERIQIPSHLPDIRLLVVLVVFRIFFQLFFFFSSSESKIGWCLRYGQCFSECFWDVEQPVKFKKKTLVVVHVFSRYFKITNAAGFSGYFESSTCIPEFYFRLPVSSMASFVLLLLQRMFKFLIVLCSQSLYPQNFYQISADLTFLTVLTGGDRKWPSSAFCISSNFQVF